MVSTTQEYKCKFFTVEPIFFNGQRAEQKVWDAVRSAFNDRENCLCFWTYPVFIKDKKICFEPDILIVDKELGIIVIEVKNIRINQITHIEGYNWFTQNFFKSPLNAYQQSKNQLHQLINSCNNYPLLKQKVKGRVLVALPSITESQWTRKGFSEQLCCPPILFQEDIDRDNLIQTIVQTAGQVQPGNSLEDKEWRLLQKIICGPVLPPIPDDVGTKLNPLSQRRQVIEQLQQWVGYTDIEQIHIGMSIPPGPQRIRGIAGSGKLFCYVKRQLGCTGIIQIGISLWCFLLVAFMTKLLA